MGKLSTERKAAGAAIIVVIVAAFLPWASFLGITKYGIEGDGQITVVLGLVGLALVALESRSRPRRSLRIVEWACAVIVTFVGLFDMNGLATVGLYLTFLAGGAWVAALVMATRSERRSRAVADATVVNEEPQEASATL
jgi:hypothetical protein